jgi:osmotically-inducible protein OsmY
MHRTDEDIKVDIVARLGRDARVDASRVLVEVENGLVVLMGEVLTHGARRTAFELAREVGGVRIVDNQLVVSHPPDSSAPPDDDIERTAKSMLSWNPEIDAALLEVKVDDGVLTLSGSVRHFWQRHKVEDLVSELRGVVAVKNTLSVVPTEALSDELIARDIAAELERFNLMQADDVKVVVVDSVVTLSGTVTSYAAEKRAYDAAAHTLGVVGVVNHMNVLTPTPP